MQPSSGAGAARTAESRPRVRRCLVWLTQENSSPLVLARLAGRGVKLGVAGGAAEVMVELARRDVGVLIICEPQPISQLNELLIAVQRYYPTLVLWRYIETPAPAPAPGTSGTPGIGVPSPPPSLTHWTAPAQNAGASVKASPGERPGNLPAAISGVVPGTVPGVIPGVIPGAELRSHLLSHTSGEDQSWTPERNRLRGFPTTPLLTPEEIDLLLGTPFEPETERTANGEDGL